MTFKEQVVIAAARIATTQPGLPGADYVMLAAHVLGQLAGYRTIPAVGQQDVDYLARMLQATRELGA